MSMLIFLYGPDSYQRNNKLQELIGVYKSRHKDMDIFSADLNEKPNLWSNVRDFLKQPSMFVSSKVAIIKEGAALDDKDWIAVLKTYLDDDKIFLLLSDLKAPKKKLSFLLKPPVKSQQFGEPQGAHLERFVTEQLKEHNLCFSAEAKQFFVSYLAFNTDRSWLCVKQLAKTEMARFSEPVSLHDIQLIIPWSADEKMFFATKKLISAHTLPARMMFLEKLFLREESSSHVFNLLAYQARGEDALKLADYDVLRRSGKLEDEEALLGFGLLCKL